LAILLDVNALIALVDADHTSHRQVQRWFMKHYREGWSTCPLTENGVVRVLSQPAYASGRRTPAEVIQVLAALKEAFSETYEFWPDDVSITDGSIFDAALVAGANQVTDIYLLGLAARHNGAMFSLDRSLVWHAVRGGSESLVRRPA
jgi:toxin-antitoxin system PIN domain toxin